MDDMNIRQALSNLKKEWIYNKRADHKDCRYQNRRVVEAGEDNGILRRNPQNALYWLR